MLGIAVCLKAAHDGGRIWWVAPSYKQALEGWAYLQRLVMQMPASLARTHLSELTVSFPSGGSIQVRTGDNPDNLRGAGLDGVVLDEAATMKREAWDLVLRPALADRQGWALFIGTPNHFNWFYELFQKGESGEQDWASWQLPTWDNPYIPSEEIEAARRDMDPSDFAQEFGANFSAQKNAIYPHFDRDLHVRELDKGLIFRDGAWGADFGRVHASAVCAISVDQYGRRWVREVWAQPDSDHGEQTARVVAELRNKYALRRGQVDPNQDALIGLLGKHAVTKASLAEGSRQARIKNVARLLNVFPGGRVHSTEQEVFSSPRQLIEHGPWAEGDTPGLLLVKGAPGIDLLCEQIEAYHYVKRETETRSEMIVDRRDEDTVAAMEYAIAALDLQPMYQDLILKGIQG